MPFSFHRNSSKSKDKAKVDEPMLDVTSGGGASSTSRPATPSGTQKPKNRFNFWSSRPKSASEQSSSSALDHNKPTERIEETHVPVAPQSFIVTPIETPFKGGPDDRAHEAEIYASGVTAVTCLQKLAGLTGPGTPNPLPIILEPLVGVLTQLQRMVKNDGDWKTLFLLIAEHLNTFNNQLRLLALAEVTPDPESALHKPIVQYSATLRELTAKVVTDAGFDASAEPENSDWNQLKVFVKQFLQAGEVQGQIEEYRNQLIKAMDLLLRELALFSAVKGEETNIVVKRVDAKLDEVHMAVQKISGKIVSDVAVGSRVFAKSLPTVSPYFVGRELELDLMKTHLVKSTHSGQKVFAITGMGGSGKTQLVSYFLQETNKEQILFTRVVFIDASSESTLKTDLQSWAQSLGFGHEQDDWSSALSFLASGISDGRWFLIYDNADDPNLRLKKYFPGCTKGTILITSRNRGVRDLTNTYHLELGKMGADDALAALEKAAYRRIPNPSKEMDDTKILMEKLGYLPLALVHAGSYCHQQSSIVDGQAYDFTISRYLTLFNKRRDALLGSKNMFTQEEYERGVYATLDLSYEVIQEASRQFLQIISHFQYSEIHLAMFQTAAQAGFKDSETYFPRPDEHNLVWSQLNDLLCIDGEPDEFQLLELIRDLQSFSLILRSESSLRMHPLVQAWARDMKLAETKNYEAMAAQILSSCSRDGNAYIYRYLLPHIKERLAKMEGDDLHINDKVAFGRVFDEVGAFTLAEPLFKQAITGYGEETNDTLKVVCYLAQSIRNQGRWEEAETLEKAVLEKRQRILGIDHPDSISAAAALAMTYSKQGRWNEAEKLEVEVLEKRNRLLGADHPSSINAAANLAASYRDQGRWNEAEKLDVEVLEKRNRLLGTDHPSSIDAVANLASTYSNQGRWNEAEKLDVEVLEKRNRLLGADHPSSIDAVANLASTYSNQGRWNEAEKLDVEVVEKRNRLLGADHPSSINAAANLAASYRDQGRWNEAEKLEVKVLEKRNRLLGADHPDSIDAVANLASTYWDQGRWNEVEELEVEVLEKRNRLLGADHPSSIDAMANLASTYSNQGRWKEAEQLQEEVLEKRIRILGADHPSSITAAASLASTYREKGRCNDAEKFEIEVPEQRNRILGVDHPDSMTAAANLAKTYRNQGRWKEAESLQEEVLENRKRVLGADHYKSIAAAAGLAVTYESQGRLKDAERVLESVVKQSVNILGPQRPHTQRRVRRMVDICTKLGKQDKAREVENYLL